ncbi:hypothetical protein P7C70_g7284, partial [Phenoliferia sp. Uapishka_3]
MHSTSLFAGLFALVALSASAPIPGPPGGFKGSDLVRNSGNGGYSGGKGGDSGTTTTSSSSSTSSSTSSSGTYSGEATYFYQAGGTGACGSVNEDSALIVALNTAQYSSSKCGSKVKVTNTATGKSVTATVADECPGCASESLDLSTGAFDSIGDEDTGVLSITWSYEAGHTPPLIENQAKNPLHPLHNNMAYGDTVHTNESSYGYTPSLAMAIVFIIIFSFSTALHTFQSFTKNSPRWMVLMAIGGGGMHSNMLTVGRKQGADPATLFAVEIIGWAGRIWSRQDQAGSGYIMQICCLIIAPSFYSAALYVLLGVIISIVAPGKSFLSSKMFKIIFIVADIFSLVLQGAGGGIAATANTDSEGNAGSNTMLAGIIIQLFVMLVYVTYGLLWARRSRDELAHSGSNIRQLLFGMLLCSIMIIIRGAYRTAELSHGFNSSLAENQLTFLLDAIPISIATLAINVWHPNRLLPSRHHSDAMTSQSTFTEMKNNNSNSPVPKEVV